MLSIIFTFSQSINIAEKEVFAADGDQIAVSSTTPSSVTFGIKAGRNPKTNLIATTTRYRPRIAVRESPSLKWNSSTGYYEVQQGRGLSDSGEVRRILGHRLQTGLKHVSLRIDKLKFPSTEYEFDIKSWRDVRRVKTVTLVARTKAVIPNNPPKTGAGCFHVFEVDSTSRSVKVYWKPVLDDTQYEVLVYENGDKSVLVYQEEGHLAVSYTHLTLPTIYSV